MRCEVCRSVRRWPISSFRQCSFLIFTGTFVLNLRAFNSSAGDGRWLSTGVALSTSSAICRSDLVMATFFMVAFTVCICLSIKPFDCGYSEGWMSRDRSPTFRRISEKRSCYNVRHCHSRLASDNLAQRRPLSSSL